MSQPTMRWARVPMVVNEDLRLSHCDMRVFNQLAGYADRDGWCFPLQETIARALGLKRQSVTRSIKNLCACGYVVAAPRVHSVTGRPGRALHYRIPYLADDPSQHDVSNEARSSQHDVARHATNGDRVSQHDVAQNKPVKQSHVTVAPAEKERSHESFGFAKYHRDGYERPA